MFSFLSIALPFARVRLWTEESNIRLLHRSLLLSEHARSILFVEILFELSLSLVRFRVLPKIGDVLEHSVKDEPRIGEDGDDSSDSRAGILWVSIHLRTNSPFSVRGIIATFRSIINAPSFCFWNSSTASKVRIVCPKFSLLTWLGFIHRWPSSSPDFSLFSFMSNVSSKHRKERFDDKSLATVYRDIRKSRYKNILMATMPMLPWKCTQNSEQHDMETALILRTFRASRF